jgi:SAM-dependent methyltransferase
MNDPHDNWASVYDFVYKKTYGESAYGAFTNGELDRVREILNNGTIIDYGAGSGRLSIPLKQADYNVIAVEKSSGMTDVLRTKLDNNNLQLNIHNCSIAEYDGETCDLALCVFTVLSYLTTEEELKMTIQNMCNHLSSKGQLFFDLPKKKVFKDPFLNKQIPSEDFKRYIRLISNNEPDVYTYTEECRGVYQGAPFEYHAQFPIRYWEHEYVKELVQNEGLDYKDKFLQFAGTGSYYLFQKN